MVNVLIVDDEAVLLEMLAALIEEAGCRPLLATNGKEALRVLQSVPEAPALVISDIMMPQMDGIELAKILKTNQRYCRSRIILMSAAGCPPESGIADVFLYKPFDLDRLMSLVERYAGTASDSRSMRNNMLHG